MIRFSLSSHWLGGEILNCSNHKRKWIQNVLNVQAFFVKFTIINMISKKTKCSIDNIFCSSGFRIRLMCFTILIQIFKFGASAHCFYLYGNLIFYSNKKMKCCYNPTYSPKFPIKSSKSSSYIFNNLRNRNLELRYFKN